MAQKFCDVILQAYAHKPSTTEAMRKIWKDKGLVPPVVIELGHTAAPGVTPGSGHFEEWIRNRKRSGPFLKSFIKQKSKYVMPDGYDVGRIGIVGFSAGCGALKEILSGPDDAKIVDFAYFCDGLHSQWKSPSSVSPSARLKNPQESLSYISEAGLESVIAYASKAALGLGPAMVVTHSQIIPSGYPSTTETALYVQQEVDKRVGGQRINSGINPVGFLGAGGVIPQPPKSDEQGGYWPGEWNKGGCPNLSAKIRAPWPVGSSFAKGWFISAGFTAHDAANPKCDTRTNSQPAHIFQQKVVLLEVYRHLLSERWKIECTEGAISGLGAVQAQNVLAIAKLAAPSIDRYGATIKRNPRLMRPVAVGMGLGADPVSCFMEGTFSNIATAADIRNDRIILGLGIAGGALGLYLLWDLWRS